MNPSEEASIDDEVTFTTGTVGYVYRVDCESDGWSYIGQSVKLDQDNIDNYYGSGFFIKQVIAEQGVDALSKRVLAVADSELELDYLEMLLIAEARRDGIALANGDWGGPRPFPTLQRCLREVLPEAMLAALKPKAFYKLIASNRSAVEAAIVAARAIPVDEFYLNFERDIRALEDLSHACPTCGSPAGEVCRTNSKSLTKPQNPSHNHKARPKEVPL